MIRQHARAAWGSSRARRRGFSLPEMMVTLVLLGLVLGALVRTTASAMRSYGEQTRAARSVESLRAAEMLITRVLRSGRADPRNLGTALLTPDPLATGSFNNVRVRSDMNADADLNDQFEDVQINVASDTMFVKWSATGASLAAAYPVRSLRFEYFTTTGTPVTTLAGIPGATRVRLTIAVPRTGTPVLLRRQTWIYLRN